MKITFLIHDVYGIGGTIRTTLNLAAALADHHDVEVVSALRHRTAPCFPIDPRVRVTPLVDTRPDGADATDPLFHRPAAVFPRAERRHHQYSRLADVRAEQYLRACDADVLVGTRPGLNVYLARFAPAGTLRVAQEHLTHDAHSRLLRAALAHEYRALDVLVTMTEADAAVYRERGRLPGVRIAALPNSVPEPGVPPSDGTAKVIAAAGRLTTGKRFDLLIDAFATVAARHADWTLRIYGSGTDRARLRALVDERGLDGRVELPGFRAEIEKEFAGASIVASSSAAESFGMTLVEAMRCGVPVVSTDCPLGPAEIVRDGVNGRLVPVGDRDALARALLELVEDGSARRRMGEVALQSARKYDPACVAAAYEDLFAELRSTRGARERERRRAVRGGRARRLLRRLRR